MPHIITEQPTSNFVKGRLGRPRGLAAADHPGAPGQPARIIDWLTNIDFPPPYNTWTTTREGCRHDARPPDGDPGYPWVAAHERQQHARPRFLPARREGQQVRGLHGRPDDDSSLGPDADPGRQCGVLDRDLCLVAAAPQCRVRAFTGPPRHG